MIATDPGTITTIQEVGLPFRELGLFQRASKVKIDGPKRSCDDMEWIISFMIVLVHWLHRQLEDGNKNGGGMEMRKAKV